MPVEAAAAYQAALREQPNDFALVAFAADFYRRAEQARAAERLYERLLSPELAAPAEFTVKARRALAVLAAERGDASSCKQALALIDANTRLRGETLTDARIRLYILGQQPRERAGALSKLQESLRNQLPTPEERLLLAGLLEATNNLGQARTHLSEVVDQYPTVPLYLVRYARVLIKAGELDEAQGLLARLDKLEPASDRVRAVRAALTEAERRASANAAKLK